jgi:hypothetical protein
MGMVVSLRLAGGGAMKIGSKENPCTLENSLPHERRFKHCLCSRCGKIAVCTPKHDFYETPNGTLECEPCVIAGRSVLVLGVEKGYA